MYDIHKRENGGYPRGRSESGAFRAAGIFRRGNRRTLRSLQRSGSGLSNDSRLKLTRAFSFIEYSAAVHDWRYAKSDGTEEKRLEADKEFRANMLDEILYRAPSWKWWKELKALGMYSLVRKLGRAAWCIAFAESATKQAESAKETGAQNG